MKSSSQNGFTLIELSIVLVIIGLIIGGILVGQDLINAAAVRAQISQIEKYNTAVNAFKGKYGELPGDMEAIAASQFGFTSRLSSALGYGNNDGIIQGLRCCWGTSGVYEDGGETLIFWQDLSSANLIDGTFNTLPNSSTPVVYTSSNANLYLPAAKIGNGNSVYVWSGGWIVNQGGTDNLNYFAIMVALPDASYTTASQAGMTVAQAYAIDSKIDDGLPQFGHVLALVPNGGSAKWAPPSFSNGWGGNCQSASPPVCVNGGGPMVNIYGNAGNAAAMCYDTGGVVAPYATYSMKNNASLINCALSFQFK